MDRNTRTTVLSVVGIIAAIAIMVFAGVGMARRVGGLVSLRREVIPENAPEVIVTEHADWIMNWDDLGDFDGVRTSGGWIVQITAGDDYSVRVEADNRVSDDVNLTVHGNSLYADLDSGFGSVVNKPTLLITMPTIEHLECEGAANVLISGFAGDDLTLEIAGAATVRSESSTWNELSLSVDGASSIDFSDSQVVDADISMDGASSLRITMAGGELTGSLNGVGNVIYGGQVSSERVRIGGLGRVRAE